MKNENDCERNGTFSRREWMTSVAAATTAGFVLASAPSPAGEKARAIGTQKQLFIDDYIIAEQRNVQKVLNPVTKHPDNPLIVPEFPWEFKEDFTWEGASVLYHPERKEFQLWYDVDAARVCYARSEDGLHWEKPRLGQVSFQGSKDNNIVMEGLRPSVIYRPDESPDRRYQMQLNAYWERSPRKNINGPTFISADGFQHITGPTFFSPDGLHWTMASEVSLNITDNSYTFYDPYSKRYVLIAKVSTRMGQIPCPTCAQMFVPDRRTLSIAFSEDFLHWSELQPLLIPDARDEEMAEERAPVVAMLPPLDDEGDLIYGRGLEYRQKWREELDRAMQKPVFRRVEFPPAPGGYQRTDFENMPVIPYEGVYIGFLWYLTITAPAPHYGVGWQPGSEFHGGHDAIMEAQLTLSRDLQHWERCGKRLPIIPVGDADDAWDSRMVFPCNSPLVVGDEIWCYYGASNFSHMNRVLWDRRTKFPARRQAVGLGKLRLDGFVSIDTKDSEGSLTTKALTFQGRNLILNYSAPQGRLGVEILDQRGQPIPGFAGTDCDPISGDSVRHVVTWKEKSDLSRIGDRPVRLRFHLTQAKLYSFAFRS